MDNSIISPFVVYLISQADTIKSILTEITCITVIVWVITCLSFIIGTTIASDDIDKGSPAEQYVLICKKLCFRIWIFPLFFSLTLAITPSTKTLAVSYLIPAIVNNEKIQSISSNTLQLLEQYTKQYLEDLKNNLKDKKG